MGDGGLRADVTWASTRPEHYRMVAGWEHGLDGRARANARLGERLEELSLLEARAAAAKVRAIYDLVGLRAHEARERGGTRADDRHDPTADAGWGPPEGADGVGHLRAGIPESVVDEVMVVDNTSRTQAHVVVEVALVLVEHLPATLAALDTGRIDPARARTMARELSAVARDGKDVLVGTVEAAVLPRAAEYSLTGLQRAVRRELLAHDPDSADERRERLERSRDVTARSLGDGVGELRWRDDLASVLAARTTIDQIAALAKKDGDPRPIGVIRAEVLRAMVLNPGGDRPEFTAVLNLFALVGGVAPDGSASGVPRVAHHHGRTAGGEATGGEAPADHVHADLTRDTADTATAGQARRSGGWVAELDGEPVTMGYARELLERLGYLPCSRDGAPPGAGLRTPQGCSTQFVFADASDGRLLAVATETELRNALRKGCPDHPDPDGSPGTHCRCPAVGPPPDVDRYRPSTAQERFVRTRDRACRMPGCSNRSGWSDLDHVIPHAAGGQTSCANLCCLCRRDHRIKTHQPGWRFRAGPDGTLHVTTPTGITRTRRPPGTDLLGLTPPAVWLTDEDEPPPF